MSVTGVESSLTVNYGAARGEVNRVSISQTPAANGAETVHVADSVPVQPGAGCIRPDPANSRIVRCTVGFDPNGVDIEIDLGDGNDVLTSAAIAMVADGPGNDVINATAGTTAWSNGPGNDVFRGGRNEDATNQQFTQGFGNDAIYGGGGNDQFSAGPGNDIIRGGSGNDLVDGDGGNDRLYAEAGADVLLGGPQGDLLFGGLGNDRLSGGPGFDRMFGGPGLDRIDGRAREFAVG